MPVFNGSTYLSQKRRRIGGQSPLGPWFTNPLRFSTPTASRLLPKVWNAAIQEEEAKVQRTNTHLLEGQRPFETPVVTTFKDRQK